MSAVLKNVVEQIDFVRLQLERSPTTELERRLLGQTMALLDEQVAELGPDPSKRKATGTIGPQLSARLPE